MSPDVVSTRVRGGVVGGTSALTAIAAHASAQGALPGTSSLMITVAAAAAIGTVARRLPALPALIAGQAVIHLLLVLLSGHHHDMISPAMAVSHAVGTIAALALITAFDALVRVVRRIAAPTHRAVIPRPSAVRAPAGRAWPPAVLLLLGSVGRRGPPLTV